VDESRQNIGSQRIHSKFQRQAVFGGNSSGTLIAHAGVVNDGIEVAERIHFRGDFFHLCDA
jgi:hypothetical protein